jgi:hypothetical protein
MDGTTAVLLAGITDKRTRSMYELYAAGSTLEEAGRPFRLSRERVRQIFRDAGLPQRSIRETAAMQRGIQFREKREDICRLFVETKDMDEIARRLSVPRLLVKEVVEANFSESQRRKRKMTPQRYSDDELIAFLQGASASLGGVLTTKAYSAYARRRRTRDGRQWPTHQTHFKRFGSWRAALHAAGLAANPPSAIAGQRLFDLGHCIDALRAAARQLGKVPTAAEYDDFARASGGALPCQATVRNRCGTWNDALAQAGL